MTNEHKNAPAVPQDALQVIDAKIASVKAANIGRGGKVNSAVSFALGLLEDMREAIAAHEAKAAPAVPQGWRITEEQDGMISVTSPDGVKWWAVRGGSREEREGKIGAHFYDLCKAMLAATPATPSQPVTLTEWISVDERLPDGEPGDSAIEFYNEDLRNPTRQVIGIYRDGVWYSGGHQFSNVSHWKPLTPAPIAALREKQGGV